MKAIESTKLGQNGSKTKTDGSKETAERSEDKHNKKENEEAEDTGKGKFEKKKERVLHV